MLIAFMLLIGAESAQVAEINESRIETGLVAMEVLLAWSAANLAAGGIGYAADERRRYFHQMNAAWNVVNAGIATAGLLGLRSEVGVELTGLEALQKSTDFEQILLLNVGLDAAYIATGGLLYERGRRLDSERLRGYGQSLWVQGGFLLVFDLAVYFTTHRHTTDLLKSLSITPNGLAFSF